MILFVFTPVLVQAEVVINEIMYDLSGSDDGREWVELYNNGDSNVDLTNWKFTEGGTNHGLTAVAGASIEAGGYAVIVDDPAKFSADWSNVSVLVFDSSFDLNNTGEELVIKNGEGEIVNSVAYDGAIGAAGNGHSLQLSGGDWIAAGPTPGAENRDTAEVPEDPGDDNDDLDDNSDDVVDESSGSSSSSRSGNSSNSVAVSSNPSLKIEVAKPVLTKIETPFYVKALGVEAIKNVEWSFGDGSSARYQSSSHTYLLPGTYTVLVTARAKGLKEDLSARLNLTVVEPKIVIESVSAEAITLVNKSSSEVNLKDWRLVLGNQEFLFPVTIMSASGKLSLAHAVTGFSYYRGLAGALYLPAGVEVARFADTIAVAVPVPVVMEAPLIEVEPEVEPTVSTSSPQATTSVFVVEKPAGWWGNTISWFKNIW